MTALSTILPVFCMIGLGLFARVRSLVSSAQANGMMHIINTVLFPVMLFNAMFTASFQASVLGIIAFVFAAHLAAMGIGTALSRFTGKRYADFSPFLMATVDGGNVCYPLYAAIAGSQYIGNVVLLDLACMLVVFLVIPVLVSARTAEKTDLKSLLLHLLHNPTVLCIALALGLNLLGIPALLEAAGLYTLYSNIVSTITAPIVGCILFHIGYCFRLEKSTLSPLLRCIVLRMVLMAGVVVLFFLLFPAQTADPVFRILVPLYFFCPPALVISSQIQPLLQTEEDSSFLSAFLSLYMVVTLTVFTLLAAFV